jgi:8-oxo-dGTP pyrophosphatase MutT (NUDIX family)
MWHNVAAFFRIWCFTNTLFNSSSIAMTVFPNQLPASRLGQSHESYESFRSAVAWTTTNSKEYTLVIVTEGKSEGCSKGGRILLGMKNRGFGKGMYNSFGGKFDHPEERVEQCASRELKEEANISISEQEMKRSKVGIQRFSFDNDAMEMILHVFRISFKKGDKRLQTIQGCEEITPKWFDDWKLIPLNNMFADDSLWLTTLLSSSDPMEINGWYHFQENCQETNTIRHYYMDDVKPKQKFKLERRLFDALHDNQIHSPTIKEFKESYAFCNAVRKYFGKSQRNNDSGWDVVIDVAGGHGALAALFLIATSATRAVVVDPARVGSVERAWESFWGSKKELVYRNECLRTGLPAELQRALAITSRNKILVVACHACQHLSEEIVDIACRFGVSSAVMPCCQKDLSRGGSWKSTSKNLGIPLGHMMDVLLAGRIMGQGTHEVRMNCLDPSITPHNRIILARALMEDEKDDSQIEYEANRRRAHTKLESAYHRAHVFSSASNNGESGCSLTLTSSFPLAYVGMGFLLGVCTSKLLQRR